MLTSTSNPQVKKLVQLQKKGKLRNQENLFIVEGTKMFKEAPKERLIKVYASESFQNKNGKLLTGLNCPVEILSDHVYGYVSDTKTPQGVLCMVKRENTVLDDLLAKEEPLLMVLDNLQDPGNMGTIIRTGEGAGVTGVIISSESVDLYHPKTIRSTMGSIYRMPVAIVEDLPAVLDTVREAGIATYAAHLEGQESYDQANYKKSCAFLIGNEGNGLRDEVSEKASHRIKIPMLGQVESLNAAIAATILMFEAARQRRES